MPKFGFLCVIGLLAALLASCSGDNKDRGGDGKPAPKDGWRDARAEKDKDRDRDRDRDKGGGPRDERDIAPKPMMDAAVAGTDKPVRDRAQAELPPGVLTAGSFDDNLYPHYFRSFAGKVGQNAYVSNLPGKFLGQRLEVRVKNGQGAPVADARVRVVAAGGSTVQLTTRSDGRAIFVSPWDQLSTEGDLEVMAALPGQNEWVRTRVARDAPDCTILLPTAPAPLPRNLDLAIVLDTTGSMGDELRYLQAEIKSIAAALRDKFPEVNQRYALVLYRDEGMGDEYTTRVFDFTASIDEFQRNLAAQRAAGGGDIPEAMHKGLQEATRLNWRDADTARVLFLIADAPPHARDAAQTLEHVNALRKKGIAIYPVAASCNDPAATEATEFFLRAAALLTGAQYLFLTDDSGVGDSHGEPHIPFYRVEKLNRLLVRMLSGELSGRRTDPDPNDVLRTVGRPPRQGRQD